jgi:hypothetical protein
MMRRWWGTLALALLLTPAAALADSADIEHRCTVRYPNITQYFAWKDCVKTETQQEAEYDVKRKEEEAKHRKEEAARPCIAADIPRMEALAQKVKAAVKSELTLEEASAALEPIIRQQAEIQIPTDNIRERVLVDSIDTRCSSSFYFLINVREGPDKKLRWLRVVAKNPPAGYRDGLLSEYSSDFDQQRQDEWSRAEEERFRAKLQADLAQEEKDREEQHKKFLRNVKISNIKMKCSSPNSCSFRTVEFILTNVSQDPVRDVGMGFMFLPAGTTQCPAKLATTEKYVAQVLQPGERVAKSILLVSAPDNQDTKCCLSVTEMRGPYSWEH